uniref:Uncharacterized protein n=1 Tax=Anguilla anguilla TaxID=7936 RepID=A0A0E9SIX1_ANGAN
MRTQRRPNKSL